jgi:hypothetical protein
MTSSLKPNEHSKDTDMIKDINFQQLPKRKASKANADINLPHQGSFGSLFTT